MSRFFTNIFIIGLVVVALALVGGLVWANSAYLHSRPVDKSFLVPWLGARTFLQYGDSPYSLQATQRAQVTYYGRLAASREDPLSLWLPFPLELAYFPLALVPDYFLARAIWMACLEIALGGMAFLCLRLVEWKPPRSLILLGFLFFILWMYGVFCLLEGSGVGFIALAMAGFLLAFRNGQDELAGGLFLLTLVTPSLTGLFGFFFLWWILFRRKWRILGGAAMLLVVLLGFSFLLLPNWFLPFLRGWYAHLHHVNNPSSIKIFTFWSPVAGLRLGWGLAAFLFLIRCVEWGAAMRDDPRHVLWTICLTLAFMPFLGVPMTLASDVILYIPLMVLLGIVVHGQSVPKGWGTAGYLLGGLFLGGWALAGVLIAFRALNALAQVLYFLLPFLLVPSLYWVRWRFLRAPRPELHAAS